MTNRSARGGPTTACGIVMPSVFVSLGTGVATTPSHQQHMAVATEPLGHGNG
jgi:hypothetical protein